MIYDRFYSLKSLGKTEEILLIVILTVLALALTAMVLMLFWGERVNNVLKRHIKTYEYNVRIYRLDYSECLVYYFDRKNIQKRVTESLEAFYQQFPEPDVNNVRTWINDLIAGNEKASEFLETKVYLKSSREIGSALYELTSIDRTRKVLHFESHLLPYLAYESKRKTKSVRRYIKSLADIGDYALKSGHNGKGAVLLIKIFSTHSYEIEPETMSPIIIQLVNHLAITLNEDRFLVILNETEIAICDFEINTRASVVGLANRIKQISDGYLTINSLADNYEIAIGMVLKEAGEDIKTLMGRGREMAILAEQKSDIGFELFDPEKDYASIVGSTGYKDIVTLIRNKTFRYYFTPLIDSELGEITAYSLSIEPYGTEFDNIAEITALANELRLLHPILKTIVQGALSQIGALSINTDIHINAEPAYAAAYQKLFKTVDWNNIVPVLCFSEKAIVSYDDEYEDIKEQLIALKEVGVEIGLVINNESVQLADEIISFFSYFVLADKFAEDLTGDDRKIVAIRTLSDKYRQYSGRFAVPGLETLNDLEIALKIGVTLFSCRELADASSNLESLDSEKKEKLGKLTGNL